MAIASSSQRRLARRLGSALAAVTGSAIVAGAVVANRRLRARRPATATETANPIPVFDGKATDSVALPSTETDAPTSAFPTEAGPVPLEPDEPDEWGPPGLPDGPIAGWTSGAVASDPGSSGTTTPGGPVPADAGTVAGADPTMAPAMAAATSTRPAENGGPSDKDAAALVDAGPASTSRTSDGSPDGGPSRPGDGPVLVPGMPPAGSERIPPPANGDGPSDRVAVLSEALPAENPGGVTGAGGDGTEPAAPPSTTGADTNGDRASSDQAGPPPAANDPAVRPPASGADTNGHHESPDQPAAVPMGIADRDQQANQPTDAPDHADQPVAETSGTSDPSDQTGRHEAGGVGTTEAPDRPAAESEGIADEGGQPGRPSPGVVFVPGMVRAGGTADEPAGMVVPGVPASSSEPPSEAGAPPLRPLWEEPRERTSGRNRWVGLGVAVAAAAVLIVGAVVMFDSGDEPSDGVGGAPVATTRPTAPSTTTAADLSPQEAFAQAATTLEAEGTFSYVGTSSALDVSPVRPGLWLAVVLTVAGEVDLQNSRWHETGVADSGQAVETVSDGLTVWGRTASRAPSLASVSYQTVVELGDASEGDESATTSTTSRSSTSGPSTTTIVPPTLVSTGPSLIPVWLSTAVDATDAGPDDQSRRTLSGTVPAAVMGQIVDGRPPVDATILLTMDAEGIPVRVEITTVPEGPRLHLVFDLSAFGDPQTVTTPSD